MICGAPTSPARPSASKGSPASCGRGGSPSSARRRTAAPSAARPELGLQEQTLGDTKLFVLPSTSPANAAVPWDERLRWFRELAGRESGLPERQTIRAAVVDERGRILLLRYGDEYGDWWVTPGGGREAGEADEQTLRRELEEEIGLVGFDLGPLLWELRGWTPAGARFRELSLPRLPRSCRSLRAAASHRGARGSLVLACGPEVGVDAAARSRGAAQLRQRLVIGVRRSRPNAFGRSRTPGGACRRLYSARSMSATARATTSGSKPSALSSSSERSSST